MRLLIITVLDIMTMMFSQNIDIVFSEGYLFRGYNDISRIKVEFVKTSDGGGYFPFWNKTNFDLTTYGIYNNDKHPCINQSCLVTAFDESGILTANEFLMLKSFIKTRNVMSDEIKHIAELLNIDIKVAAYNVIRMDDGKMKDTHQYTSIYTFDNDKLKIYTATEFNKLNRDKRKVELTLLYFVGFEEYTFGHYMLSAPLEEDIASEYFPGKKCNITMLIKEMFRRGDFEPMTDEVKNRLNFSFVKVDEAQYNTFRPINIPQRKLKPILSNKVKYSKFLFGFDVTDYCVDVLLSSLQKIVDRLVSGVDVDVTQEVQI